MLNEVTYKAIEGVLYDYVCGNATSSDVHSTLGSLGFKVDLRRWYHNEIEISNFANTETHLIEV